MGLGSQFKWKYFAFGCSDDERESFYRTQYSKCRGYYMAYRFFMWIYQFGWFLAYYIHNGIHNPYILSIGYRFLTRWGYIINVTYFTLAFVYSVIGYAKRDEQMIFRESRPMLVFRSTTWLLHSVGQTASIIIVVLYWGVVYSPERVPVITALNVDSHGTNLALYLIEIFVVAFPMRLLHVIYPVMVGSLYVIATVIMHAAGDVSAIYSALNWAANPKGAAGFGLGAAIGGGILGHLFMFLLYQLRIFMARSCSPYTSQSVELRSSVNQAYEVDSK